MVSASVMSAGWTGEVATKPPSSAILKREDKRPVADRELSWIGN